MMRPRGDHITTAEALTKEPDQAGATLSYGPDDRHVGDLRLPQKDGPNPVVVLIHGGCWQSMADRRYMSSLAARLTESGWATWNVEFRPIDVEGGGWPGTFLDVAAAVDHVRRLARSHGLDAGRVVVLGHSSGGHLALWAAARHRLPPGGPLGGGGAASGSGGEADGVPGPVRPEAVVGLGAIADLEAFHTLPPATRACGDAIPRLLGGAPVDVRERLALASPAGLLPLGVPQLLVTGADDRDVPPAHGDAWVRRARDTGDRATHQVVPDAGHFEVVAPWSPRWPAVEEVLLPFLRGGA